MSEEQIPLSEIVEAVVVLGKLDGQLSQALSEIDKCRIEIAASSERTRVLRDETVALLASVKEDSNGPQNL